MTEHPYQLRRIELRDFKSVAEASVDLRPLTVVVGANSSGKSTLLQSILALTQAVRSDIMTPEFPLNGEFVRLGTFYETKNFLSKQPDTPMSVAFDLVDTFRSDWDPDFSGSRTAGQLRFTWRSHLEQASDDASTPNGFARVVALQIEIASLEPNRADHETLRLVCDLDHLGGYWEGLAPDLALAPADEPATRFTRPFTGSLTRTLPIQASGRVVDWSSGTSASVDAVMLAGGLPTALLRYRGQFEILADLWWDVAMELFGEDVTEHRRGVQASASQQRKTYGAVRVAATHVTSLMELDEDRLVTGQLAPTSRWEANFLREIGSLGPRARARVSKSLASLDLSEFRARLRRELGSVPWIDDARLVRPPGESGELLTAFSAASQRFFADSVRYLGALREAPHVLYDPGPTKRDLGIAGQYSAAVLHAQANVEVLTPTPEGRGVLRPLGEALDFWLREIGLVEGARSKDEGRLGIGLNVTPMGLGREVDLTSVGVGVSQVLPVILLCLLAEPGDLVILEEPDLHLHPMLQQRLADFLLACTRAGRQLIVETHNEHLVNRLRFQIAKDPSDETHSLIRLVFAENDDGVTSYREPVINQYGGLGDDWPKGFLDLTATESQALVRESLAKRKRDEASAGI
jgi:energy-coupling factor transporter ATP-binding protein EcfA2